MAPAKTLSRTEYNLRIPAQYVHLNSDSALTARNPLLVFIHGYADTASSFVRRAANRAMDRFELLAPNGPFPLPQRVDGEWKEAYAWYFADFSRNRVVIHPTVAADAIAELVDRLGFADRAKILCGFSQGGYFLPHLASRLKNVASLVTIGAGFHPEFYSSYGLRMPVTAIHGDQDEVVPFEDAKSGFAKLKEPHAASRFIAVSGMTHAIDDSGRGVLERVLLEPSS